MPVPHCVEIIHFGHPITRLIIINMCYHYSLSMHCSSCGREISRWLEVFCMADYCKEASRRLNPHDRCYFGRDPSQYPRKDVKIPGTAYNYFLWGDHECEICEEERQDFTKRAQNIVRAQDRKLNSNQKDMDSIDLEEIKFYLSKGNFSGKEEVNAPAKPLDCEADSQQGGEKAT